MSFRLLFLLYLSTLGACQNAPPIQVIDVDAITAVQDNIAQQVGTYIAASRDNPSIKVAQLGKDGRKERVVTPISALSVPPDDPNKAIFACGLGNLNFDISDIKVELATTADNITGISGSATVPVELVTLGPSLGTKTTVSNSQSLKYQVWPIEAAKQTNLATIHPSSQDISQQPIAAVLVALRQSLIGSATRYDYLQIPPLLRHPKPCFTDYNPKKVLDAPANTYTLALSVSHDTTAGLTVKVTVLTLGVTSEWKSSTGNSLTVSFAQPGLEQIALAQALADDKCKTDLSSKACTEARKHHNDVVEQSGKIGILSRPAGAAETQ